jgi:hypothetical protein
MIYNKTWWGKIQEINHKKLKCNNKIVKVETKLYLALSAVINQINYKDNNQINHLIKYNLMVNNSNL